MEFILQTVNILADLLIFLIIARTILSWFVRDQRHGLVKLLSDLTEPILRPIRRATPRMGMLDLSPFIALIIIQLLRSLINSAL